MCLICVDFQKQQMTVSEARRALGEMRATLTAEHLKQVEEMLQQAEDSDD